MKKLLFAGFCLLLAGLCACGKTVPPGETTTTKELTMNTIEATDVATEASTLTTTKITNHVEKTFKNEDDEKSYFAKVLNNTDTPFDNTSYGRYAFYDIDGDGMKELLIGIAGQGLVMVYTIQNGVAVEQKEFYVDVASDSGHPPPVLFKNGAIRTGGENWEGVLNYNYYRFEGGELKWQITLRNDFGQYYRNKRDVDPSSGTPITKAEYDRLKKEIEGDGQVVELDWKPLAEYGR